MAASIVVKIKRGKAILLGVLLLPIAIISGLFFILAAILSTGVDFLTFLALLNTLAFGGTSWLFFGIALRQPTALRMDAKGISGYYADPTTWDQIASIDTFSGHKGHRFLGFALHDPVAFRDRQTAWGRLKSWSYGRGSGHHIVIPEALLRDANVTDLAQSAKAFHMAHKDVT